MQRGPAPAIGLLLSALGLVVLACESHPPRPVPRSHFLVKPDGTGDFATIQAAITAAEDGDVIELADGVFSGDGNRDIDFDGKDVTVRSQGGNAAQCIIDCGADSLDSHRGFYFHRGETAEARIEGLTIAEGYACGIDIIGNSGAGVLCYNNASPTIQSCIFLNNTARGMGGGMHCETTGSWGRCTPQVRYCLFSGNTAGSGGAIAAWAAAPLIENCTVVGNRVTSAGGAVDFSRILGSARIIKTIVAFNSPTPGVVVSAGAGSEAWAVACCDIYGNEGGDWVGALDSLRYLDGNICADPLFLDPDAGDYGLSPTSPCCADSSACGPIGALPGMCQ